MQRFQAIFFDFDGVLVDTEALHAQALLAALKPYHLKFTELEFREQYLGRKDYDLLKDLAKTHGSSLSEADITNIVNAKIQHYLKLIQHEVPVYPHVKEVLAQISKTHHLSLVTGSNPQEVAHILRLQHWHLYFDTIISAGDVRQGKPHPEGYLKALSLSGLPPEKCVVVEDAPRGVQAAKAAGLTCIAITNNYHSAELAEADYCMGDLQELSSFL